MSEIISRFREDHARILEAFEQVEQSITDDPDSFPKSISSAKDLLLAHLAAEEKDLYPPLREEAKTNRRVDSVLELYAKDMVEIAKVAEDFFTKYQAVTGDFELVSDFGKLYGAMQVRIRHEEHDLYPEFDKLSA